MIYVESFFKTIHYMNLNMLKHFRVLFVCILKDLSHVFLLLKSLKRAKIISPFSVQLLSILPRKRFIRIFKICAVNALRSSAIVCAAPRMILVKSLYDQTQKDAEQRRRRGTNAEDRRKRGKTQRNGGQYVERQVTTCGENAQII